MDGLVLLGLADVDQLDGDEGADLLNGLTGRDTVRGGAGTDAVFTRDGQVCVYCGSSATSIDHVVPRSRGGTHTWDNVVAACRPCNSRKENRSAKEVGLDHRASFATCWA